MLRSIGMTVSLLSLALVVAGAVYLASLWVGWWTPLLVVALLVVYGVLPVAIFFNVFRPSRRSKAAVWILAVNFAILCLLTSLGGVGPGFFFLPAVPFVFVTAVMFAFSPVELTGEPRAA
jgi:hypothetical protein